MTDNITTIQSSKGTVWRVPLPNNPNYPYTLFHRRLGDGCNYTVVLVNVDKFLECNSRDTGFDIPPFKEWSQQKIDGFMDFMRPSAFDPPPMAEIRFAMEACEENIYFGSVEMPIAHIEMRRFVQWPGLLGRLKLRKLITELPVVSFTNGRHRTCFVQAMGVKHFPVEVERNQAALMRHMCGVCGDNFGASECVEGRRCL